MQSRNLWQGADIRCRRRRVNRQFGATHFGSGRRRGDRHGRIRGRGRRNHRVGRMVPAVVLTTDVGTAHGKQQTIEHQQDRAIWTHAYALPWRGGRTVPSDAAWPSDSRGYVAGLGASLRPPPRFRGLSSPLSAGQHYHRPAAFAGFTYSDGSTCHPQHPSDSYPTCNAEPASPGECRLTPVPMPTAYGNGDGTWELEIDMDR